VPGGAAAAPSPDGATAGPRPLLRLSVDELNNTLADLLGDTTAPASALPSDRLAESRFPTGNDIDDVDAQHLFEMAEGAAARAMDRLPQLAGCTGTDDVACARQLIVSIGRRAWRRPVEPAEVASLEALYAGRATASWARC
jgi:hypothetical protein